MQTASLNPFRSQARVIFALILRDIRTRFFGHGLGYIIAILWPVCHIFAVIIGFTFARRAAPYGDSVVLFAATGAVPFMTFSYMSRFIMFALIQNRPLMVFPAVKVLDVVLARAILEVLASCCSAIIVILLLIALGIDPWPRDVIQAASALGAVILLGLGLGIVNGLIALAVPTWTTGYMLLIIILYLSSGILFVSSQLPAIARELLALNPILHGVEWMRSAYYESYGSVVLDKTYMIGWGLGSLLVGLLIERFLRRGLLQG